MSEQEPGTPRTGRTWSASTARSAVPAAAVPAPRRDGGDLLAVFTPERAAVLALGRSAVRAACRAVLPPRPEDPRGVLLPVGLQRAANTRISAAVGRARSSAQRTWVLEGVVVGFAEQAAAALRHHGCTGPEALLRARAGARPAPTATERGAVDAVLAVVGACAEADAVALAWAVECLWSADADERTVLSVAASACSACLELTLDR